MKILHLTYQHDKVLSGHEEMFLDANIINKKGLEKVVKEINKFKPDIIIEREYNDGKAVYTELYNLIPDIPKAYWCIDAHITLAEHINYAKQFDIIFLAQSWFAPLFFNQVKSDLFYLPLCVPLTKEQLQKENTNERDLPFTFVGNIRSLHPERKEYVSYFLKNIECFSAGTQMDYEKMRKNLERSQLTFNCSLNNDLNFRVWEAMAFGTPLVTDYVTDMELFPEIVKHCGVYYKLDHTPEVLADICKTWIKEERYRAHVDTKNWILYNHTLTHRYQQALQMILTGKQYEY